MLARLMGGQHDGRKHSNFSIMHLLTILPVFLPRYLNLARWSEYTCFILTSERNDSAICAIRVPCPLSSVLR